MFPDAATTGRLGEEVGYLLENHRLTITCVSAITVAGGCSCGNFYRRVGKHTSTDSLSVIYHEFGHHMSLLGHRK